MTEDEARQKWCPFARSRAVECPDVKDGQPIRKIGYWIDPAINEITTKCIASDCMAWRTYDAEFAGNVVDKESAELALSYKGRGYCGLAGK